MTTPAITAAFDFAADLRNPAVRDGLKALGFDGDTDVVVAYGPDESRAQAAVRALEDPDGRRVLLVCRDGSEASGWRMEWLCGNSDCPCMGGTADTGAAEHVHVCPEEGGVAANDAHSWR